jgi:hypothetical protein
VRDAADYAFGPTRGTARPGKDRNWLSAQPSKCRAGARAGGGEFASPAFDRLGDDSIFFRKQNGGRVVTESFDGDNRRPYNAFNHANQRSRSIRPYGNSINFEISFTMKIVWNLNNLQMNSV